MLKDMSDWNHYMTPRLAPKLFNFAVIFVAVQVLLGFAVALATFGEAPLAGLLIFLGSILAGVIGVIFARMVAEALLLVFRMEAHLAAMRKRWEA